MCAHQGSVGCKSTPLTRSVRCTSCFCCNQRAHAHAHNRHAATSGERGAKWSARRAGTVHPTPRSARHRIMRWCTAGRACGGCCAAHTIRGAARPDPAHLDIQAQRLVWWQQHTGAGQASAQRVGACAASQHAHQLADQAVGDRRSPWLLLAVARERSRGHATSQPARQVVVDV
jgi:hypothetical protein